MLLRPALAVVLLAACGDDPASSGPAPATPAEREAKREVEEPPKVVGTWRATLASGGGELPFTLEVGKADAGALRATIINGPERIEASRMAWEGDELVIGFDVYDSEIRTTMRPQGLDGAWSFTTPKGRASMPFSARPGEGGRFVGVPEVPAHEVPASIDGDWSAVFTNEDGSTYVGQGVFRTSGDRIDGTFLTDTGDFRYLDGRYHQGRLELSCFDGSHAFLFRAEVDRDGALVGDFWSRGDYHAGWRATRMAEGDAGPLADPYGVVGLTNEDGRFAFEFPDLSGKVVGHDDPRFSGNVVLIDIFGTWCPNCNDFAPLLARWHREYGPRGLEIVGLAYEMTGEPKRDRKVLRTYAEHYGIEFPLLLAGASDKAGAAASLPSIDKVVSYPTTVLVGRDGKVRRIHSGFAGPATGEHHRAMVSEMEREIEALLAESAAPTDGVDR